MRSEKPPLTVGSLFAGIGGFDLGFERAGFRVLWQVEREPFCQKVLARRFSDVPVYDDVRTVGAHNLTPVDVIVGGFPCQDVSVAGRREGLEGERSGLFYEAARIISELKPTVVVIENVPGLLSSHGGRDFHAVLSSLAERGFRRAYRILDSRYFGVAQRRRRVFIVLRAGTSGERPREVLLESESRARRAQAGAEARTDAAATLRGRSARRGVNEPGRGGEDDSNLVAIGVHANQRGELRTSSVAGCLSAAKSGKQLEAVMVGGGSYPTVTSDASPTLTGRRGDQSSVIMASSGERERALTASMHKRHDEDTDTLIAHTLTASAGHHGHSSPRGDGRDNLVAEVANTLLAPNGGQRTDDLNQTFTPTQYGVRRLTPLECERVQGFPDGWTCLCGEGHKGSRHCTCPDTPRYKATGNAVTVPVAEWIARRILDAETAVSA